MCSVTLGTVADGHHDASSRPGGAADPAYDAPVAEDRQRSRHADCASLPRAPPGWTVALKPDEAHPTEDETVTPQPRAAGDRGSVLFAVSASIIVGGLVVMLFTTALLGQRTASFDQHFHESVHVAESGLQEALVHLSDLDDPATPGTVVTGEGSSGGGEYAWEAVRGAGQWEVRSRGDVAGVDREIEATIERETVFWTAAFGGRGVTMRGGNSVSSYNHADGEYDTGHGSVGTNGVVELLGNASTDSAFLFGAGADCDGNGCSDAEIFGESDPYDPDDSFVSDRLDECISEEGSLTSWRASDQDETPAQLPAGEHCFTDLILDEDTVVPDGEETVLYLSGDVVTSNHTRTNCPAGVCSDGPVDNGPDPTRLQVYTTGEYVRVGNHNELAAAIYAPNASCQGNNANAQATVYGSLVCNDLRNQGGWSVHFADDLLELGSGQYRVTDWRET